MLPSRFRQLVQIGRAFISAGTANQAAWAMSDQLVASAANFATGVVVGRVCLKEEFGLYMLALTIVLVVVDIQKSLISTPYTVISPRLLSDEKPAYAGSALVHNIAFSALAVAVLAVGAVVAATTQTTAELGPVVEALAVAIPFILLREFVRRFCFASLSYKPAFLLDLSVLLVQIVAVMSLAYFRLLSAPSVYLVIGLASGLASIALLVRLRKNFSVDAGRVIDDLKSNWEYGQWIFASGLIWTVTLNLYPWVLTLFHGTSEAGILAACIGVVAIGNPVIFGMQNMIGPRTAHEYAQNGPAALWKLVIRFGICASLLIAPFCVVLILLGGDVAVFLYGGKYSGNGLTISLLAMDLFLRVLGLGFAGALFAMGRAKLDFLTNLLFPALLLTIGLILTRDLGPRGVAGSLLATTVILNAIKAFQVHTLINRERHWQGHGATAANSDQD